MYILYMLLYDLTVRKFVLNRSDRNLKSPYPLAAAIRSLAGQPPHRPAVDVRTYSAYVTNTVTTFLVITAISTALCATTTRTTIAHNWETFRETSSALRSSAFDRGSARCPYQWPDSKLVPTVFRGRSGNFRHLNSCRLVPRGFGFPARSRWSKRGGRRGTRSLLFVSTNIGVVFSFIAAGALQVPRWRFIVTVWIRLLVKANVEFQVRASSLHFWLR